MSVQVTLAGVAPGTVLAGRYQIDHVVPAPGAARAFLGSAVETGQSVMLLQVGANTASLLARALLLAHPNLATLLELFALSGGDALAVVEYPRGQTLKERLEAEGRLPFGEAVAAGLGVARALGALHQRGAAHGLLRPASVVLHSQAPGGAILAYAPAVLPPNPFRMPERGFGAPSPGDDVWALAALLHHMVLGRPPPDFGVRHADDLAAAIDDRRLRDLIAQCLRPQPAQRVTSVSAVADALAELGQLVPRQRLPPVPAPPPSLSPKPAGLPARPAAPTRRGIRRLRMARPLLTGIGVGVLAVAAVAAVVLMRVRDASDATEGQAAQLVRRPRDSGLSSTGSAVAAGSSHARSSAVAHASASPSGRLPGLPVSADSLMSGEELVACVARQLPEGAFALRPDFDWLCLTHDPRKGASKMRSVLVAAAGAGNLTRAMELWSRMRWYSMAAFAVIRASCCEAAEPLVLPEFGGCEPLDEILNDLGATVAAGRDYAASLERYTKSIRCHHRAGRARQFRQRAGIGGGQRSALLKLLEIRAGSLG